MNTICRQKHFVLREHSGNSFFYTHAACMRALTTYTRLPIGEILGTDAICVVCKAPLIVIPLEDAPVHTSERAFCADPLCPCHHDPAYAWENVGQYLADSLITQDEAHRIFQGQQV